MDFNLDRLYLKNKQNKQNQAKKKCHSSQKIMNPQNGQELTLKDIAKDLSKEVAACDAQACEPFTGFTYASTPLDCFVI
jgi:hypothetical protein